MNRARARARSPMAAALSDYLMEQGPFDTKLAVKSTLKIRAPRNLLVKRFFLPIV